MPDVPWEPHWEPTQSECPTLALDRALLQGLSSVPGPLSTRSPVPGQRCPHRRKPRSRPSLTNGSSSFFNLAQYLTWPILHWKLKPSRFAPEKKR